MNYEEKLQIIQAGCPKLRFSAQFTDQSSQWNYSRHAHPYLELLYFTEGGGGIDVSGQRLCAGILDTIVYPAGWEHQEQASAARKREIICLWIELPELQLEKPIQIRDHDNLFGRLFSYLYREAGRPDASEYVLEYGMKLLLTELLRCDAHQTGTPERLQLVMQYLQANYAKPITLSQLAALEHVSVSYLSRQFRRYTGKTVITYLNELRVQAAQALLKKRGFVRPEIVVWTDGAARNLSLDPEAAKVTYRVEITGTDALSDEVKQVIAAAAGGYELSRVGQQLFIVGSFDDRAVADRLAESIRQTDAALEVKVAEIAE